MASRTVSTLSAASLRIEGMSCASCVGRLERAIRAVPGVAEASVNLATERADIRFDKGGQPLAVVEAIRRAGYATSEEASVFAIEGMTCASCVARVERALKAVQGVTDASVNLAAGQASVRHVAGLADVSAIKAAIRAIGYDAKPLSKSADAEDRAAEARQRELSALRRSLIVASLLTLPLFLMAMVPGLGSHPLLEFLLATLVLFGPGLRFYRKGIPALVRRAPDMNSLVTLGTAASWGYSVVATFLPRTLPVGTAHLYYEASSVIVTLILLGRTLEARAKGRTSQAIKRLVALRPKTARVLRNSEYRDVPLDEVVPSDLVQVRPGDRVPVDGVVVEGSSLVDEAMISGEPVPVRKEAGAEVTGGTINKTGSFTVRVSRTGADTLLAQIIRMVEQSQGSKLPIQALVDMITAWFVPAVMTAAFATFAIWMVFGPHPALGFALVNAVAVLIIACPCAMGLATPTSIMVGTGRAAEWGVLFRNGEALQALRDVSVVALDKTGTLTAGHPELTDLVATKGFDADEVLGLVAAVEAQSEHPIATAIVGAADARGLARGPVTGFEALPGYGVIATVDGRSVEIGADRLMSKQGLDLTPFAATADRLGGEGKSPLYAAIDGRLAAIIAVADPIKEASPAAISALHSLGIQVAMITGDNRRTADAIAHMLGIDEVVAEVLPAAKVDALRMLRSEGRRIAFVGDGINDAPALAEADVGIAIGTGTDIAIESADVVLMSGDVRGVPNAIGLGRATIRNIHQNLFWAFAYNVLLIPVAAGGLYPVSGTLLSPMLAAGAMAISSVFVLGNALRLRKLAPTLPLA